MIILFLSSIILLYSIFSMLTCHFGLFYFMKNIMVSEIGLLHNSSLLFRLLLLASVDKMNQLNQFRFGS